MVQISLLMALACAIGAYVSLRISVPNYVNCVVFLVMFTVSVIIISVVFATVLVNE